MCSVYVQFTVSSSTYSEMALFSLPYKIFNVYQAMVPYIMGVNVAGNLSIWPATYSYDYKTIHLPSISAQSKPAPNVALYFSYTYVTIASS